LHGELAKLVVRSHGVVLSARGGRWFADREGLRAPGDAECFGWVDQGLGEPAKQNEHR
jgi:hypothetical protein